MMADAVEAASRTIKKINEKAINDIVEDIINHQLNEEQFSYANITFKDIPYQIVNTTQKSIIIIKDIPL